MDYDDSEKMKEKHKKYSKAMKDASVVEGPADVLKKVKHRGKILGKYNSLIY